jgi:succinate dehydrogenase/fumarate reductase flavoprotein subunit
MVTDLLQEGERICGAVGFERRTGEFHLFEAKATIIATGSMGFKGGGCGIGFITGDGMAMSYRCGAEIVHAEFLVGCHRTGLKSLDTAYAHVFGGNYLNRLGYPIEDSLVTKAHHTGELNKCLEMAKQHHAGLGPFYIDLSLEDAKARIDRVREQLQRPEDVGMPVLLTLERAGIDVRTSMGKVEITLFHQGAMGHGGIRVDKNCRSQLEALYVSGDSAGVLLSSSHWGSGLASAAVTGNIAGKNAAKYAETINHISLNPSNIQRLKERTFEALHRNKGFSPDEATLMVQKAILPYDVQIVRHGKRLQTALKEIERLRDDVLPNLKATDPHDLVKVHEVRNMALCAEITLRTSLFRKESRIPTFYREDYPERDDENWLKWTVTKEKHGRMEISGESVPFSQYEFKPWQKEC